MAAVAWRVRNAIWAIRRLPPTLQAWLAFRRNISAYTVLDEMELKATRTSDTVFIFGSGRSLSAIPEPEYRAMEAHNTIGFNWFVHQRFVRCDYHLVREIVGSDLGARWRTEVPRYFALARQSPMFARTIFLVQSGFRAINGNRAIGYRYLPADHPVFLFRTRRGSLEPSASLREGLTHAHGTLSDCVNAAALLGWTRIVLVGVDLYDRRYFWLGEDESTADEASVDAPHRTAVAGVVEQLRQWRAHYEPKGIHLYTYNPKSLLAAVLPLWPAAGEAATR
ncbi:MAG: hypothetical protein ABI665_08525 [Vicinamibacterales bacterium]